MNKDDAIRTLFTRAQRDEYVMEVKMAQILDPVCDMIVDIDKQRERGLTSELLGKTYAFCGPGCKRTFDQEPGKYTAKVSAWEASGSPGQHEHGGHGTHGGH